MRASVSITNTGTGSLTDQPWLAISAGNGTAPATVQIVPSVGGLAEGTCTGHVTLTGGGTSKTVTVVLSITAPAPVQHAIAVLADPHWQRHQLWHVPLDHQGR